MEKANASRPLVTVEIREVPAADDPISDRSVESRQEVQAVADCAKRIAFAASNAPSNRTLNIAARLLRALSIAMHDAEEAREAGSDDDLERLDDMIGAWLVTSSKSAPSPYRYLVNEVATHGERGGWELTPRLQPLERIDQPEAAAELLAEAEALVAANVDPKKIGDRMSLAIAIYFPSLCPPGSLHEGMLTAGKQIAEYASGKSGKPWSERIAGGKLDAERLAVAALRAFGMPSDKANGLYKARRSRT